MNSILTFDPVFVHLIWGGDRIARFKGLPSQGNDIGESWELSPMLGHESVVDRGPYKGRTLNSLLNDFGSDIMGERLMREYAGQFPLLIKFIDSKRDLSIQVHPDDEMGARLEGKRGKTEMWYCVAPEEGAYLYDGFKSQETPQSIRSKIENSTIVDALCKYYTKPGDVFFLPAGCVHAIGQGNFLVEIQQASDVTYRIFDYNRRDAAGNLRELHIDKAQEAIKYDATTYLRPVNISAAPGATAPLVQCPYFHTDLVNVDGEIQMELADRDSFTILISTAGELTVSDGNGDSVSVPQGRTVLIPASVQNVRIAGKGELISVYIP